MFAAFALDFPPANIREKNPAPFFSFSGGVIGRGNFGGVVGRDCEGLPAGGDAGGGFGDGGCATLADGEGGVAGRERGTAAPVSSADAEEGDFGGDGGGDGTFAGDIAGAGAGRGAGRDGAGRGSDGAGAGPGAPRGAGRRAPGGCRARVPRRQPSRCSPARRLRGGDGVGRFRWRGGDRWGEGLRGGVASTAGVDAGAGEAGAGEGGAAASDASGAGDGTGKGMRRRAARRDRWRASASRRGRRRGAEGA